jgi:hypothetical protein
MEKKASSPLVNSNIGSTVCTSIYVEAEKSWDGNVGAVKGNGFAKVAHLRVLSFRTERGRS